MTSVKCFFVVFIAIWWSVTTGNKLETLKKCCSLGTNYAKSGLKCATFQPPIAGVLKSDEAFCLNSVDVCCKKQYRLQQCDLGQKDADAGNDCNNSNDEIEGSFRKDCCEACELGLQTGPTGQVCESELGLGPLMDAAFETCCNKKLLNITTAASPSSTTMLTTSTTTASPLKFTKSLEKYDDNNPPPLPSLEALCDIPDLCAHICIQVKDSYKCECYEGFTLMADKISCKPNRKSSSNSQRCAMGNPCDHKCIDTGVAIKCTCYEGYEIASDKRTCKDIDECALGIHECMENEICVNTEGDYDCEHSVNPSLPHVIGFDDKCPEGYKFDGARMVCDDIDECEIDLVCPKPGVCINTIGSFKCEAEEPKCPPGFYYKESIKGCNDIDECLTGKNSCNRESQICLNTKGNYTCIDKASKKTCPPGFKKNVYNQQCEDINECEETKGICAENEMCINEPGGHNCIPKVTPKPSFSQTPKPIVNTHATQQPNNINTIPKHHSSITPIPAVYTTPQRSNSTQTVVQLENPHIQPQAQPQVQPQPQPQAQPQTSHQHPIYNPQQGSSPPKPTYAPQQPQKVSCSFGYRFSERFQQCVDIDECTEDPQICDSNQDCYNTVGSYICNCKHGFSKDYQTGACVDINECQVGQHDCSEGQRCDNTIGSYLCSRTTGCGTGYTLNSATALCEDDDECLLGSHNCHDLGIKFQCRNTLGSYRCEKIKCVGDCYAKRIMPTTTKFTPIKIDPTQNYPTVINQFKKCLPGYRMNPNGVCEDINECESNPCKRGEKCLNLNGRYQCIPYVQCQSGYELNEAGNACDDINECTKGTHKCKSSQICKNGPGYYICQCPPGHKLNLANECEDINECDFYRERICSRNAYCINTIGSYKCDCKEGFRENGHACDDIDECAQTPGLCHQNCVNLWGSYRCSCERGFTLSTDNRTCNDIDECEKFKDRHLCVGACENIPGSYSCRCPDGYKLGADGRTCQDIDECQRGICRSVDDVCVNTRGSYKCHTIICPPNYIKDPDHKSRCKRASNICDIRDINCTRMPGQYSYHFVTFVSNLPIPDEGKIDFFQMKGPAWVSSTANFDMSVQNLRCSPHIQQADQRFFRMKRDTNKVVVSLVQPIQGPQEIELKLQMELYVSGAFQGKVVSTVYVFVSEYEF